MFKICSLKTDQKNGFYYHGVMFQAISADHTGHVRYFTGLLLVYFSMML